MRTLPSFDPLSSAACVHSSTTKYVVVFYEFFIYFFTCEIFKGLKPRKIDMTNQDPKLFINLMSSATIPCYFYWRRLDTFCRVCFENWTSCVSYWLCSYAGKSDCIKRMRRPPWRNAILFMKWRESTHNRHLRPSDSANHSSMTKSSNFSWSWKHWSETSFSPMRLIAHSKMYVLSGETQSISPK